MDKPGFEPGTLSLQRSCSTVGATRPCPVTVPVIWPCCLPALGSMSGCHRAGFSTSTSHERRHLCGDGGSCFGGGLPGSCRFPWRPGASWVGRNSEIRTHGLSVPNGARCQAAPYSGVVPPSGIPWPGSVQLKPVGAGMLFQTRGPGCCSASTAPVCLPPGCDPGLSE